MKNIKRFVSLVLCVFLVLAVFPGANAQITAQEGAPLVVDSLTADLSSPQPAGTAILFSASGSGGTGGLQYKFSYEKDGVWVRIQDYSKLNTVSWRPPEAGTYTLTVFIKDTSGTEVAKGISVTATEPLPVEIDRFQVSPSSSQPAGTAITLEAQASGGQGEFEYKFSYEKDGVWYRIQDYSASSTALWVPSEQGSYSVVVFARDAAGTEAVGSTTFQVTAPPQIQVDSLTADRQSPQDVGTPIRLSASGSGGTGTLQYKFSYEKNGSWVRIRDYSEDNTVTWTPQQAGDYTLTVFIRDQNGVEVAKGLPFHVEAVDPAEITKVQVDGSSPHPAGSPLQISAQAQGGIGELSYKFSYEKDGKWVRIQDYSSSNTATWAPEEKGSYQIVAFVKDNQGIEVAKGIPLEVTDPVALKVTSFEADQPSPQYTGTAIRLTAQAEGDGELQYKFLYHDESGWQEIQGYSEENTAVWKPTTAGDYSLVVFVKNSQGQETTSFLNYRVISKNPIVVDSLTTDKRSPQMTDTSIELTAKASGGVGELRYRFAYQKEGEWVTLRDYSSSNSYLWTPKASGEYVLGVFVKDESGSEEKKEIPFIINAPDPITIGSFSVSPEKQQMLGSAVQLSASASGGVGELEYRFAYQKSEETWVEIQDYSSSGTAKWTPKEAGSYQLAVFVRDAKGNEEKSTLSYTIQQPDPIEVTEFTLSMTSPQQPGTTIRLSATATGGVGSYQYRFAYQKGGAWVYLGDYSSSSSLLWTPMEEGDYTLAVFVKDSLGVEASKTTTFQIEKQNDPLEITSFTTNKVSPQVEGTSIQLSAQAQGGSGGYEYQFSYKESAGDWTNIKNASSASSTSWMPAQAGLYTLRVTVRSGSETVSRDISYIVNRYIAADTGGITLSGKTGSVTAGKSLYIKASGSSNIKWMSENPSIASISSTGYIQGVNPGKVRVVAYDSAGHRVSCTVTVQEAAPIKFAYTSPNIVPKNSDVSLVAITDLSRTAVEFDVQTATGTTTVEATQKEKDGNTYKWTAKLRMNSAGSFEVKAYSRMGSGGWETCEDGKTSAFVTASTDVMTTRVEERRASDRCLDFIATCEGFSSTVYPDTLANNIPTVAYGYVFYPGDTFYDNITKSEGWALLVQETNRGGYTSSVNRFLLNNNIRFNQQQFDSLISFSYNVGTGWITSSNTKDLRNILLRARSSTSSGGGGTTITTGIVSGGGQGINVRSGPGTNYPRLYALSDGTVVTLIDETKYNGAWYKLKTTDGSAAYCHSDYISNVKTTTTGSGGGSGELDLNYVDKDALITEMSSWHHAGGKCVLGLLTRRYDELEIFLNGEYNRGYSLSDHKYPIPSCYK